MGRWIRETKHDLEAKIRPLREQRMTHAQIGQAIGKSAATVWRICKLFGIAKPQKSPNIVVAGEPRPY